MRKPTGDGTVFADIPGLVEGASAGVGLGHEFLRHIERTELLLHLVDITDVDPVENFETIENELEVYGRNLEDKRQVLALNKVDAVDVESSEIQELVSRFREMSGGKVFLISAVAGIGLEELMQEVWRVLEMEEKVI